MNPKDLTVNKTVYHRVNSHWGRGTVTATRTKDAMGLPNKRQYQVSWHAKTEPKAIWVTADELVAQKPAAKPRRKK